MSERINPNNKQIADMSPKDIKQLEILRPRSAPLMGQRHKQSLEKEKRLEVASRPIQLKPAKKIEGAEVGEPFKPKGNQKKNKKNKSKASMIAMDVQDGRAGLEQEDMVGELDWSDEE